MIVATNCTYLYYESYLSQIALVIHFRLCLFASQMHGPATTYCVARLRTVSIILNFTK